MKDVRHIILTRFWYEDMSDDYIQKRIDLFKKYTLPSVSNIQAKHPIEWQIRSNLNIRDLGNPNAVIVDKWKLPKEPCITSRLDNDDMLLPDFYETVQDNIGAASIVDVCGYILEHSSQRAWECEKYGPGKSVYLSPFISLFEVTNEKRGVYFTGHHQMHKSNLSKKIVNKRLFVQVIHDTNVSNSVRGLGKEALLWNWTKYSCQTKS